MAETLQGCGACIAQAPEWYREDLVGQALLESSVPRDQVFLTSKLHPRWAHAPQACLDMPTSSKWAKVTACAAMHAKASSHWSPPTAMGLLALHM